MESTLSTLAFALFVGAQFLGAVVLISKRKTIFGLKEPEHEQTPPSGRIESKPADLDLPVKAV